MSKSTKNRLFLAAFLIGGGLLVVALFADLSISNAVINYNSIFGTLFQTFGLFAAYLVFVLAGQIGMAYALRHTDEPLFAGLLFLGGLGLSAWQLKQYLNQVANYGLSALHNIQVDKPMGLANSDKAAVKLPVGQSLILWIVVYLLLTILIQYWLHKKDDQMLKKYLIVAVFASLTLWFAGQVNGALKTFWGRFRPYELNHAQTNFTSWVHPNGPNGHMSFPSGHAMAGTVSILFSWFAVNPKTKKILWVSGVVFAILMAISRVVIGAHFLSDVTFSFLITAAIIYVMEECYHRLVPDNLQL
ncbi:phosphatase PAP2 family protein [Lactiplantibacillus xiangfangensis]|uniref:Membrane-associated phospholipid phosphatase n=1 Tax=Lactiplantibacillus xiangfangensis TaxID=942150 RepID=A0A0R2MAW0_9LACO|nr:phosphatase PAP2 family protein [Lactiplantibacillus xiangfangensis]KRO09163.1 membrane-associated phospholipid phosphatase [Lactiplantibacillus xiangfangensis]